MIDTIHHHLYPLEHRLSAIQAYKKSWETLRSLREETLCISSPEMIGISGGALYYASQSPNDSARGFRWTISVRHLPGQRVSTIDIPYEIETIRIDPFQELLVIAELDQSR